MSKLTLEKLERARRLVELASEGRNTSLILLSKRVGDLLSLAHGKGLVQIKNNKK